MPTTLLSAGDAPAATTPEWWANVLAWLQEAGTTLLTILAIVVGGILLSWLLKIVIRRVVNRVVRGAKSKANVLDTQALERSPLASVRLVQRTRTLGSILQNIVNVAIVIIALMLIVSILMPNALTSLTLLTAAIGAGLGFGAQNIVKDVLNGIFIVAEDQIGIGDVVDLGLATGIVEYVSVRVTHVRDVNGTLWYVRNGEITRIGNMSQGWSRVIIDLGVPVGSDLDEVEALLLNTAEELAQDAKWRTRVIEHPEVWGLESVGGEHLMIRLVIKTRPAARDDVARELRVRVRRAMAGAGIDLPQLAAVTLTGTDAARRVRGANPPKTKPTPLTPATDEVQVRPLWRPKRPQRRPAEDGNPEEMP
ncbi:mechanosensitive ion channel family protein [Microbacterium thalassium]|uniref:Small conductance mechanosensitive channel n=1 Tax=Microbacterium thalassium TaxID=362649 RepID=A0A7X0KVH1_9MICO|nr:mechanosensitive ion channel domain-containing protein [Microbacterium thalassium]MBB6392074.1 small conductance mechanosensitive channel [Microbacterium thalassium]GLK24967.1 mechanosensitive ion channel protein MscS [Microbacterium thalassium]